MGVLVAFLAGQLGVDFGNPPLVATVEEGFGFDELSHAPGVVRVLRHHQHEGVDRPHFVLLGVGRKLDFHMLVVVDAVFELDALQRVLINGFRVEVGAGGCWW